jgi:hypothetical protein
MSKAVDPEHADVHREVNASVVNATSSTTEKPAKEVVPELKTEPKTYLYDADSIDDSCDITSETSTRLVKFQLFETKSVCRSSHPLTIALLHPRLQSKRNPQSHSKDRSNCRTRGIRSK